MKTEGKLLADTFQAIIVPAIQIVGKNSSTAFQVGLILCSAAEELPVGSESL